MLNQLTSQILKNVIAAMKDAEEYPHDISTEQYIDLMDRIIIEAHTRKKQRTERVSPVFRHGEV